MTDLLADLAPRSVVFAALALILRLSLRAAAPAHRHRVTALALAGLLALPLLSATLPAWRLPVPAPEPAPIAARPSATEAPAVSSVTVTPAPLATKTSSPIAWHWIWLVGVAVLGLRLLAGLALVGRLLRHGRVAGETLPVEPLARAIGLRRRVRALYLDHDLVRVPMAIGGWRPTVLLPDTARHWPDARRDAALRHELAHLRRGDWTWQMLAGIICALHWPDPLVWLLAAGLRADAEEAADALAVASGIPASDYAAHLLAIARPQEAHP